MINQLNYSELEKLIKDLADAGIQEIRFTGGEPLLYKKIYELIDLSSRLGIYTSLGTNGTLLFKDVVEKLKDAGLNKVVISIDGTKDIHDLIRGEGTYDKAMSGLKYIQEIGIKTRINSVIMRSNMNEVIELAKELHKMKINLFIRRFIESGRGTELQNNMLSKEDYDYVRTQLHYELSSGPYVNGHYLRNDEGIIPRIKLPFEIKGCKAGQRALAIMPDGDVHLCGFLAAQGFKAVGNIREIYNW